MARKFFKKTEVVYKNKKYLVNKHGTVFPFHKRLNKFHNVDENFKSARDLGAYNKVRKLSGYRHFEYGD